MDTSNTSICADNNRLHDSVALRELLRLLPSLGRKRAEKRAIAEADAAVSRRQQRRAKVEAERATLIDYANTTYSPGLAKAVISAFDSAPNIVEARRAAQACVERANIETALKAAYRHDIVESLLSKYDNAGGGDAGRKIVESFDERHGDFEYYSYDDRDIIVLANTLADRCAAAAEQQNPARRPRRWTIEPRASIADTLHGIADTAGIERATADGGDPHILFAKYTEQMWWRPRLRRMIRRRREELAIESGLVSKYVSPHSSRLGQAERSEQLDRNAKWAAKATISTGEGDERVQLSMAELVKSKETSYQAELVAMLAGLRDMQDAHDWDACMITVTCPGQFRRDGITPAKTADHLRCVWARSRAKAKREGLDVRGCQVWQPHKDATAHQHVFAIGDHDHLEAFAQIIRDESLRLYPDERGASERRCDIVWEDSEKGRLSSYAARYVTRYASRDGDTCATDRSTPEDAWYSAHSIRRVSFFGLPPKELWRYFYSHATAEMTTNDPVADAARQAAQAGRYADFCETIGWDGVRSNLDYETIKQAQTNRYGEVTSRTIGVRLGPTTIFRELRRWFISCVRRTINPTPTEQPQSDSDRTVNLNCPREGKNASDAAFDAMIAAAKAADPVPIPF